MRTLSTAAAISALTLAAACGPTTTTNTTTASAGGVPAVNVTCPGDISVNASQNGPVFINGAQAQLTAFSDTYWEATGGGITASISRNPDGTGSVSYSASGANGICT